MGASGDIEYINRLMAVMKQHPNLDLKPIVHHDDMGFEPHEKAAIEKEIHHGGDPHEKMAQTMVSKGQVHDQIRQLHKVSVAHPQPDYQAFADALADEFMFGL